MAFGSSQFGFGQTGANTDYLTDDLIGVISPTLALTASNKLTMTRGTAGGSSNTYMGWEVVEFDSGPVHNITVGEFTKQGTFGCCFANGLSGGQMFFVTDVLREIGEQHRIRDDDPDHDRLMPILLNRLLNPLSLSPCVD